MPVAVYAFSVLLQWHTVRLGLADATAAAWLTVLVVFGVVLFVVAVHGGFSASLSDPALTMPQMIFAMVAIAIAYRINSHERGALMTIVALVVVFGAFRLSPSRCRQLGWIAVALLACAMVAGALQDPVRFEPQIEFIHFMIAAVVLPTTAVLAGQLSAMRVDQRQQKKELQVAVARLHELATHDDLTGLVNRRHVQDWIAHEVARGQRTGGSLCLALIDLDHFKRINDVFGHTRGDDVLRIFSREAAMVLREIDVLARWGGEEFLLLMPDTAQADALQALHRLRDRMAEVSAWAEFPEGRVTFSAGLTTLAQGQTPEGAMQRADAKLYDAKRQGRDRIVVDTPSGDTASGNAAYGQTRRADAPAVS